MGIQNIRIEKHDDGTYSGSISSGDGDKYTTSSFTAPDMKSCMDKLSAQEKSIAKKQGASSKKAKKDPNKKSLKVFMA